MLATCMVAQKPAQKKKTGKRTTTTKVDKKTQLKNEKTAAEKARKRSQEQAARLTKNIKVNLDSVLILNHQISRQKTSIDSLSTEITSLNSRIDTLGRQLTRLKNELEIKRQRYAKSVVMMRRQQSVQEKLMFIFSSENFAQLIRRIRYTKEYSLYQRAQARLLNEKQNEVMQKQNELLEAKANLQTNLSNLQRKQTSLLATKSNCEKKVAFLNKNLTTVQKQITEYQRKIQDIDKAIDRIVQAEIEAARRAEEARRKAEAEARERARKLAEARAAQQRARQAQAAAEEARRKAKTEAERKAANEAANRARLEEQKANADINAAGKSKPETWQTSNEDVRLSSNFESNKGRLPIPVTGTYAITGHYGNYMVDGLKNVMLNNKGIDIRTQKGASARAVFDGTVSSVFEYAGQYIVMVRHGSYISVYSGLRSVSVRKGQNVKTRDTLGAIGDDSDGRTMLHFQLRHLSNRLNPEQWLGR